MSRLINFQVEILKHIDLNNGRMETRLEAFEKKTKAAMFNFNQVLIHFILLTMSMTMVIPFVLLSMSMAMFSVSMLMFTLATLQNMKESFAEERNDCQERMERR